MCVVSVCVCVCVGLVSKYKYEEHLLLASCWGAAESLLSYSFPRPYKYIRSSIIDRSVKEYKGGGTGGERKSSPVGPMLRY